MRTSILALSLSACVFVNFEPRELARESLTLDASDAAVLDVLTRAGDLEIIGEDGRDSVEMEVVLMRHNDSPWAAIADETAIDALVATLTLDGDTIDVDAFIDLDNSGDFSTDVLLRVPAGLVTIIDDTSGPIEVDDVGDLTIDDSSGDIEGSRVGALDIRDSSGAIAFSDIGGDVVVDDSSGEITLDQVAGFVAIDDSSGAIVVSGATGLDIRDDSGEIDARDIDGDVDIDDDSGGIRLEAVSGRATIRDTSGDIIAIDVAELDVVSDTSGDVVLR